MEGYKYWYTNILMTLGTVSTDSWTLPNVQADICVMLVQLYGKCSCAT